VKSQSNRPISGVTAFWQRYKRNRLAVLGLGITSVFVALSIVASLISPFDPLKMVGQPFLPPMGSHPMGTDDLGRDIYSGVLYGSRISLIVGFLAAGTSVAIGMLVGGISGFFGGKIDDLLMRITELFMVIPRFFLALILVALFGANVWNIIFVIGILSWPGTARLVRAEFLSLKEREFVEAAKAQGAKNTSLVFEEILPNATPPIIVNGSLEVARAILLEAGLSFLGLGDPKLPSWGVMLSNAQRFIRSAWWMAVFPGFAIFLVVLGLNLVGDGLNDALNPRLKEK
jgi:peptide/nickel transport system permease protein